MAISRKNAVQLDAVQEEPGADIWESIAFNDARTHLHFNPPIHHWFLDN